MNNSREIASLILSNVYQGKKLDWALNTSKNLPKLDSRDRAFVNLLVLTALRRQGQIDKITSKSPCFELKSDESTGNKTSRRDHRRSRVCGMETVMRSRHLWISFIDFNSWSLSP